MHLQHLYFWHIFMLFCINFFLCIEMSQSEKVVAFVTEADFELFIRAENPPCSPNVSFDFPRSEWLHVFLELSTWMKTLRREPNFSQAPSFQWSWRELILSNAQGSFKALSLFLLSSLLQKRFLPLTLVLSEGETGVKDHVCCNEGRETKRPFLKFSRFDSSPE